MLLDNFNKLSHDFLVPEENSILKESNTSSISSLRENLIEKQTQPAPRLRQNLNLHLNLNLNENTISNVPRLRENLNKGDTNYRVEKT